MKKILCLLVVAVLSVSACSKKNTKTTDTNNAATAASGYGKDAKYQIIDQEFDNLLAPDTDYDTLCAYELQACGDSYLPPAAKLNDMSKVKAAAQKVDIANDVKNTRAKKVVNVTNVYEVDGPNPNVPVSSKTTTITTYANGKSTTTTTTSSGSGSSTVTSK